MTKYQPLSDRLAGRSDAQWRASFSELEEVLGFSLPKAARSGTGWWSNTADKAHSRAWLDAGWQVTEIDQSTAQVTFRRPVTESAMEAQTAQVPAMEAASPHLAGGEIQPLAMKLASEKMSRRSRAAGWGLTAAAATSAAIVAGVGTLLVRGLVRRGRS